MKSAVNCTTVVAVILAAGICLAADPVKATDLYSSGPFADPIRSEAENAVESAAFNNWLNDNYASADQDARQGLKEHLYSIIDTYVRQLHARSGELMPKEENEREMLAVLFRWAQRMGALSAPAVLKELKPAETWKPAGAARVPDAFTVEARGDLITLASASGGWAARFPYHFMLMTLDQFESTNGLETQIAIISTGFGRHTSGEGSSQATIMVTYSPEGTFSSFEEYWRSQFNLTTRDLSTNGPLDWPTYASFDADRDLHTELVFPKVSRGAMAVAFLGLSDTFEHNRPHFVDFLRAMELPATSAD